jgi:hypothetical protein
MLGEVKGEKCCARKPLPKLRKDIKIALMHCTNESDDNDITFDKQEEIKL